MPLYASMRILVIVEDSLFSSQIFNPCLHFSRAQLTEKMGFWRDWSQMANQYLWRFLLLISGYAVVAVSVRLKALRD
jgi:hypothetical protein